MFSTHSYVYLLIHALTFICISSLSGSPDSLPVTIRDLLGLPASLPENADSFNFPVKDSETPHIQSGQILHVGVDRLLISLRFSEQPNFLRWSLILNLDLDDNRNTGRNLNNRPGTDFLLRIVSGQISVDTSNELYSPESSQWSAIQHGDSLYISINLDGLNRHQFSQVRVYTRLRGLSGFDTIQVPAPVKLDWHNHNTDLPPMQNWSLVLPPDDFDYITPSDSIDKDRPLYKPTVLYTKLADRGLSYHDIRQSSPVDTRPLPLPSINAHTNKNNNQGESPVQNRTKFHVTNETGKMVQNTLVQVGIPLPKGKFSTHHIPRIERSGTLFLVRSGITSYWSDGSVKTLLVDFEDSFSPHETHVYDLSFDSGSHAAKPIHIQEYSNGWQIDTGVLQATISKRHFRIVDALQIEGRDFSSLFGQGFVLTADDGIVYSTSHSIPEKITLEENGTQRVTFRIEGKYSSATGKQYMRYITRVTFRNGSSRIQLTHTHINDELEYEFSHFKSLSLPLSIHSDSSDSLVDIISEINQENFPHLQTFIAQIDENAIFHEGDRNPGRMSGAFHFNGLNGYIQNCWQRYPKALEKVGENRFNIWLLPALSDTYGHDLPSHLRFPFVQGHYRLKWGMSFTERITLEPGTPEMGVKMQAESQQALVAVLPSDWWHQSRVLGPVAPLSEMSRNWDDFFTTNAEHHKQRQLQQREYGFLNYGDWHGERARNWGNNEYDTAHALLSQFIRTGNPELYRMGLLAARHQADVDIVHAYPDPSVVGGNIVHGVAHSGTVSHLTEFGLWSHPLHVSAHGSNGHTWTEGMTEAWYLTGDGTILESAIKIGEHMSNYVIPNFVMTPETAPRKAGWALRAISAIYLATNDPFYKQAAQTLAKESVKYQSEEGAWFIQNMPIDGKGFGSADQEDFRTGKREVMRGAQTWQLGIFLGGLKTYHAATSDPYIEEPMRKLANFLYHVYVNCNGWPYFCTPDSRAHPGRPHLVLQGNLMMTEGILYTGTVIDSKPGYLEMAQAAVSQMMRDYEIKPYAQHIIYTLRDGNSVIGMIHELITK